jgi:hypothetical protein
MVPVFLETRTVDGSARGDRGSTATWYRSGQMNWLQTMQ